MFYLKPLTTTGIGLIIQNVKTLEPLKTEKWFIYQMAALVKLFFIAFFMSAHNGVSNIFYLRDVLCNILF